MIDNFDSFGLKKQFNKNTFNDKGAEMFFAMDFGSSRMMCVTCVNLKKDDTGYFSFSDYSKSPDFVPPLKINKTAGRKKSSKR